jgi:DNA-binding PadR family transcriptional regulator
MRYRSSVSTSYHVLATIAEHKEFAQYDLPRAINKDYRTVLRHLKHLEKKNLIRLARREPAQKRGKDRKIYTITFLGLVTLLKLSHLWDHAETVDAIAEQYAAYLPLLFGKWRLYAKHDFRDTIARRVQQVIGDPSIPNPLTHRSPDEEAQVSVTHSPSSTGQYPVGANDNPPDAFLQPPAVMIDPRHVTERVLASNFPNPARFYRLLTIAAKDQDLRRFFDQYMEKIETMYAAHLQTIREWRTTWSQLTT